MKKPRLPYCWECGRRFRSKAGGGKHFAVLKVQGHDRELHIECAKGIVRERGIEK